MIHSLAISYKILLKRVADGEMQGQAVLELADIVISVTIEFRRIMEADAAVEAEDEEVQVVTQAEAGAQGDLFGKFLQREGSVGASCIGAEQPDVARIEEDGAVEVGDEVEAVFYIGFQADVAQYLSVSALAGA